MKTRIDRLGDRYTYIELVLIHSSPGTDGRINVTMGNDRHPDKETTLSLSRGQAYQVADTLRAMAFSADYRVV